MALFEEIDHIAQFVSHESKCRSIHSVSS